MISPSNTEWRKSSRSGGQGDDCVELAGLQHQVAVRDSKDPAGPVLAFSRTAWRRFAQQVREGAQA